MAFNNPFAAPNPYPAYLSLMCLLVTVAMVIWLPYRLQQLLDNVAVHRRNSNARGARARINASQESQHDDEGCRFVPEEIYYAGDGRVSFNDNRAQLDRHQERLDRHRRELLDLEQQLADHGQALMGYLGRLGALDRIQEAVDESLDAHDWYLNDHGERLNQFLRLQRDTARQIRTLQDEARVLRDRVAALEARSAHGHVADPRSGRGQPVQGRHANVQQRPQAAHGGVGHGPPYQLRSEYDEQAARRPRRGLNPNFWARPQPTEDTLQRPYAHDEPHVVARHEANQSGRSELNENRNIQPTQEDPMLERFRHVRQIIRRVGHQRVAESLARSEQAAADASRNPVAPDNTSGTVQTRDSAENATTHEDKLQQQRRDGHPRAENASGLTPSAQATASHASGVTADAGRESVHPAEGNGHAAYVESADEEAGDEAANTGVEHASDAPANQDEATGGRRGSSSSHGSIPIVLDLTFEGARECPE